MARGRPAADTVSINVSPVQFRDDAFVTSVLAALDEHHLPAHLLCIEITETSAVLDLDTTLQRLAELTAAGIEVELRLRDRILVPVDAAPTTAFGRQILLAPPGSARLRSQA